MNKKIRKRKNSFYIEEEYISEFDGKHYWLDASLWIDEAIERGDFVMNWHENIEFPGFEFAIVRIDTEHGTTDDEGE